MPATGHTQNTTAETEAPISEGDLEAVLDVPITVTAILGTKRMAIADVVRLGAGSVLELERQVGEPIDLYVDGRLIARGEVVLADDRLAITMTEIVKPEK
ncbi:MAG: flagellar motor switch protein FliN [Hyphomicrobiales bacterium]